MKPTWIVQNNLGSLGDVARMEAHALAAGFPFQSVKIRPFTDDVPVDWGGPVVLYGSCGMIRAARKTPLERGIFKNDEGFSFNTWRKYYRENLLNYDATSITIGEFIKYKSFLDKQLFIRSDDDEKTIVGHISDFQTFYHDQQRREDYDPNKRIIVSIEREIYIEYRTFIVDGKVVSVSQYGNQYSSKLQDNIFFRINHRPEDVIKFANKMAALYCPHKVFVMDVCYTPLGMKIVELNGFNSSGFYACNIPAIMDAVNKVVEKSS